MSYSALESSSEAGRPVELFEFALGPTIFRWTSAEDVISAGGNDFTPTEITRSVFTDGDPDPQSMEIVVPSSNPLAQMYVSEGVPDARVFFRLMRLHRGDGELRNIWAGRLVNVAFSEDNEVATMTIQPLLRAASRLVPRWTFQAQCQNVLGDARCGVDLSAFTHHGQVTAVDEGGKLLTVDGLEAALGVEGVVSGTARFGSGARMVLRQIGDQILLLLPFSSTPLGQTISVTSGCRHTLEDCSARYGNVVNYNGFPWVPRINVFESGIDGVS